MKHTISFLVALLISIASFAQTGINYKAIIKDGSGNVVASQPVTVQFIIYEGSALTNNVYQESHPTTTDANGVVILNIGEGTTSDIFANIDWGNDEHWLNVQVDTGSGLVNMGTTQFMAVPYALNAANVSGLETLDEGNGIGWRLIGSSSVVYGPIGYNAIDLSIGGGPSNDFGATGSFAIAMGNQARASGDESISMGAKTKAEAYRSIAIGSNNIGGGTGNSWSPEDSLFEIGNSLSSASPSNALTVLKNGTITAPSFDISEITNEKALITKEYLDANVPEAPSGLEQITEGTNTGWRLKGFDTESYGNIGDSAVDLSNTINESTTLGATGKYSIAMGFEPTASGEFSTAMGYITTASGSFSTALGRNTNAPSYAENAIGSYNTIYTPSSTNGPGAENWNPTDRLFVIGNSNFAPRSDAFIVLKNGTITAPSLTNTLINTAGNKALTTKEYVDNINIPTGLEALNEGNGVGWRLIGADPIYFDNIGLHAVDFSFNESSSLVKGAIGNFSTAFGNYTEAYGSLSFATGFSTSALGVNSVTMGKNTVAYGDYSMATGYSTIAHSYVETTFGQYSTLYTPAGMNGPGAQNWNPSDRLFVIGNGIENDRNDALIIYKNGNAKFDGELQHSSTGNANMMPIAYGSVSSTGSISGGSGNFSVTYNSGDTSYSIFVNDEPVTANNSAGIVTVNTSTFRTANTTYDGINMIVHIFLINGNKVQSPFQFVIYKE